MRPLLVLLALASGVALAADQDELAPLAREAVRGSRTAAAQMEQLASEGDPLAEHALGLMYLSGKGVPRNDALALEWLLRAAQKGQLESAHDAAVVYERATDPALANAAEARRWYRYAAQRGLARSQANLAALLIDGTGGPKDTAEARKWLEAAAAQDEPHGQYLLAMQLIGEHDAAGRQRAVELLKLAAAAEEAPAQYRLALLYGAGLGVERSNPRALEWLRKAADQGYADAEYLLAMVLATGRYQTERDDKAAAQWLRRAARQGHGDAQLSLALALAEGRGVDQDISEAYGWMLQAARGGNPTAAELVEKIRARLPEKAQ